eukprot:TRINITY_DN3963_c0_g1_i3.p1 TRINITY_DN3963_c0_g1~~TRINITY_DN3963_c0_g1_i3.p1  ORF type:complete len:431 (-),score=64.47 TRINITY_DN3963_c0_g1_i3:8-1300(-)
MPMREAYFKALQAYSLAMVDYSGKIKIAKEALKISPICPEAYNILAETAPTLEQALEYYQEGLFVSYQLVPQMPEGENIWNIEGGILPLRAQCRCMLGVANTLRKMGRYEESIPHFLKLMEIDNDPEGKRDDSYISCRFPLLDVYLSLGRYDECRDLIMNNLTFFESKYSFMTTQFTSFLLDFYYKEEPEPKEIHEVTDMNQYIFAYLFETKSLPSRTEPFRIKGAYSLMNAAWYVRNHLKHWKALPGALDWLKFRYVCFLLNHSIKELEGNKMEKFVWMIDELVSLGGHKMDLPPMETSLHYACGSGQVEVLQFLLHEGLSPNLRTPEEETPLHSACKAGHSEIVKILLDNGADINVENKEGFSPLTLACSRSYFECVEEILKRFPHLANHKTSKGEPEDFVGLHPSGANRDICDNARTAQILKSYKEK